MEDDRMEPYPDLMQAQLMTLRKGHTRYILCWEEVGAGITGLITERELLQRITGQMGDSWSGCNYTRAGDPVLRVELVGHVKKGVAPGIINESKGNLDKTKIGDLVE